MDTTVQATATARSGTATEYKEEEEVSTWHVLCWDPKRRMRQEEGRYFFPIFSPFYIFLLDFVVALLFSMSFIHSSLLSLSLLPPSFLPPSCLVAPGVSGDWEAHPHHHPITMYCVC